MSQFWLLCSAVMPILCYLVYRVRTLLSRTQLIVLLTSGAATAYYAAATTSVWWKAMCIGALCPLAHEILRIPAPDRQTLMQSVILVLSQVSELLQHWTNVSGTLARGRRITVQTIRRMF